MTEGTRTSEEVDRAFREVVLEGEGGGGGRWAGVGCYI